MNEYKDGEFIESINSINSTFVRFGLDKSEDYGLVDYNPGKTIDLNVKKRQIHQIIAAVKAIDDISKENEVSLDIWSVASFRAIQALKNKKNDLVEFDLNLDDLPSWNEELTSAAMAHYAVFCNDGPYKGSIGILSEYQDVILISKGFIGVYFPNSEVSKDLAKGGTVRILPNTISINNPDSDPNGYGYPYFDVTTLYCIHDHVTCVGCSTILTSYALNQLKFVRDETYNPYVIDRLGNQIFIGSLVCVSQYDKIWFGKVLRFHWNGGFDLQLEFHDDKNIIEVTENIGKIEEKVFLLDKKIISELMEIKLTNSSVTNRPEEEKKFFEEEEK